MRKALRVLLFLASSFLITAWLGVDAGALFVCAFVAVRELSRDN